MEDQWILPIGTRVLGISEELVSMEGNQQRVSEVACACTDFRRTS